MKTDEYSGVMELLDEIKDNNTFVIVEGKNDKKALEEFGVKNILLVDVSYKVVEKVNGEGEVVLLVDLDKEGKRIYHQLKQDLIKHGVKINNKLREFLFKNTKIRQIEGLSRYLEGLRKGL